MNRAKTNGARRVANLTNRARARVNKSQKILKNTEKGTSLALKKKTMSTIARVPKLSAKPSRKSKVNELKEKFQNVTQFLRQSESLGCFWKSSRTINKTQAIRSCNATKVKKIKQQYQLTYLPPDKRSLPRNFDIVHVPKALELTTDGETKESPRQKPNGYLCPSTATQVKLLGVGQYDVELRFVRQKLPEQIKKPHSKEPRTWLTVQPFNGLIPAAGDAEWQRAKKAFEVDQSTSKKLTNLASATSSVTNKTNVKVKKNPLLEAHELKDLTKEYNELKENYGLDNVPRISNVGGDAELYEYVFERPSLNVVKKKDKKSDGTDDSTSDSEDQLVEEYGLGEVWELRKVKKTIKLPPCPKSIHDTVKLDIMLEDASTRMKQNLEKKTYEFDIVQAGFKKMKGSRKSKFT
jgi:hypothetical protein